MKKMRNRTIAFFVLIVSFMQPVMMTAAYAGPLSDYVGTMRARGLFTSTHAGFYGNQDSGYRAGIGGTFIFPGEAQAGITAGFKFDFGVSCMGMDFNAEAFANLKLAEIVDWLKQLLISYAFTYMIGMATASPLIKGALDSARHLGQSITQLLQSPCELGSKFGSDAQKKGFEAFGSCVSQSASSLGSGTWLESYSSCIAKKPIIPPIPGDTSTKENVLDMCVAQFAVSAPEKTLLGSLLGNAGFTRTKAGVVDIKGIKPPNITKDYNKLFKYKVTLFTTIIQKIVNAPIGTNPTAAISGIEQGELTGPGMSIYASDIRNLRLLSKDKPITSKNFSLALAQAMAISEFKFAITKLSELLVKCGSIAEVPKEIKDSLKLVNKQLIDFMKTLDSTKKDASIQRVNIIDQLEKSAKKLVASRLSNRNQSMEAFGH